MGERIIATVHIRFTSLKKYLDAAEKIRALFHDNHIHSATIQPEFSEVHVQRQYRMQRVVLDELIECFRERVHLRLFADELCADLRRQLLCEADGEVRGQEVLGFAGEAKPKRDPENGRRDRVP